MSSSDDEVASRDRPAMDGSAYGGSVQEGPDDTAAGNGGSADDGPPAEPEAAQARPGWYLLGVIVATVTAAVIRAVNILVVRPTCVEDLVAVVEDPTTSYTHGQCDEGTFAIWGDSAYGYLQARLMAEGHWFVDGATWYVTDGEVLRDSAGDPPLYALALSGFARLGLTSGTSMRLLSALAGVVGVVLLAMLARRLAGPVAGLVAAGLAAVYPMLWINDAMLLSESLFVPLVVAVVLVAYRFWDTPSLGWAAGLGATIGVAALTRSEAAFLALLVVPVLWGAGGSRSDRFGRVALCWLAAFAMCVPWFAYNLSRFEEPVLMTAQSGAVISAASCDATFYGDRIGYWDDCMAWYIETGRVADWPDREVLDESQVDAVPMGAALDYTRENAGRLPVVVAARIGRMWDLYKPGESVQFNAVIEGRGQGPSTWGLWAYFAMLPFAVGGAVVLYRMRVPLSPLLAVPGAVTITAALTFGITRYRAPADAILVVLASVAVAWLVTRRSGVPLTSSVRRRDIAPSNASPAPSPGEPSR